MNTYIINRLLMLLAGCVLLTSCFVSSKPKSGFFYKEEYQNSYSVKEIKVPMLIAKIVAKKELRKDGEDELAKNLKLIKKVRVTSGTTKHLGLIADIKQSFNTSGFTEWVTVRSSGKWVLLSAFEKGNTIKKLKLGVLDSESSFKLIDVKCNITTEKLSAILQSLLKDNEFNFK